MAKVIAVAGKGGTGKTTLCCLVLRFLSRNNMTPVLALDADPNSNLGESLGIDVTRTIGDIREEFMKAPDAVPSGMDKINYLHTLMNQVLIEDKDFDLLVMGRQEGAGCYCMVNNIFRKFSDDLTEHYKYLIADNEAGMEHLSRRTNGKIDNLFMVTDYSLRGLRALRRIHELIDSLNLEVKDRGIVVSRAPENLNSAFLSEVENIGLKIYGTIPDDPQLMNFDMEMRSLMDLEDTSLSAKSSNIFLKEIFK